MAARRKSSSGKGAMMRQQMAKRPGVGKPGGVKKVSGKGVPSTAKEHKAVAHASRRKQVATIPEPGAALGKLAKPTAAPRKKKK